MFLNKILGNSEIPTSLNLVSDPLKKSCIESISIRYGKGLLTGAAHFSGTVVFKNNSTSLEQKIEGENLLDVYTKVAHFCMNLPD